MALRSGFTLLLISGFGLILYYWLKSPELLSNPKIWAKTAIVTIAAVNGFWIERKLLPFTERDRLFAASSPLKVIVPLSISWGSWTSAFVLGAWKSINFVASFQFLMGAYVAIVLFIACVLFILRAMRVENSLAPRG